ncbi:MAG: hypothetical protein UIH99_01555 [Alphaproteobacteria bacterium]|nr:hypothetical protein [Alphaproteobacteria bacterium]
MKINTGLFSDKKSSCGNMLIELLLSIALAALIIPFIFRYHQDAIRRAENIAITEQMASVQSALERYIVAKRSDLLTTVGRNITRVSIEDLIPYGVPDAVVNAGDDVYQIRVIKSADSVHGAALQGIVVRVSDDISPMRTREIIRLSDGSMGFIDGKHVYGTFGAWHTDAVDLGVDIKNGIIETTSVNQGAEKYLWRVPSDVPDDAKMLSALSLGGHDIINTKFFNSLRLELFEKLSIQTLVARDIVFQNRTTIDSVFTVSNAVVSGMLSSDSKNMDIAGTFSLSDKGKFSSVTTNDLWVTNLSLGGFSVESDGRAAILKVNQSLDMTSGRIDAIYVTVGHAGSITPRLYVYDKIADSSNSEYYWDVQSGTVNFSDAIFAELNRMAELAVRYEGDKNTQSGQIFGSVSANKNATVSDFMHALSDIQNRVREKYQMLNLE